MIKFKNTNNEPHLVFLQKKYHEALNVGQKNIEAIVISSYNSNLNLVDSRFVNLKFVDGNVFTFFSNYNSPKSIAFKSHNQISATFFWQSINTQIRMKAHIYRSDIEFNKTYFKQRSRSKNALAISSNQSETINSYDEVIKKYNETLKNSSLSTCPDYWGGFSFEPFEVEFWEGKNNRLNKRDLFIRTDKLWEHSILEP